MVTPLRWGTEFLINTTLGNSQTRPNITALADGRFVVVWSDISLSPDDPSSLAVRAQVFNADGSHSGAEFLVNTTTTGSQAEQSITALADGRFVVAWTDDSHSTANPSGIEVLAQVFNADGTRSGAEFLVNTTTPGFQSQPSITALADGRFAVAWHDISASPDDPSGSAVRGQIFDPREAAVHLNGTLAADDFRGTHFGDVMAGSFGNDRLAGAAGDDNLNGEEGNDTLFGGAGNDRLFGGDGKDVLNGGTGSDRLDGGSGNDWLNGGVGADAMTGGAGNDRFVVDLAGDLVIEAAGSGTDQVRSANLSLNLGAYANVEDAVLTGAANLNLTGSAVANLLVANAGNNGLFGGAGNDRLFGNAGNDRLFGGAGNDRLFGGAGNDTLFGGNGNDRLTGGNGTDRLFGGAGADVFVFQTAAEIGIGALRDRITDFATGVDHIDLHAIQAGQVFIGAAGFSGVAGQVRYAGGLLSGDLNGDQVADFTLQLDAGPALSGADLIL